MRRLIFVLSILAAWPAYAAHMSFKEAVSWCATSVQTQHEFGMNGKANRYSDQFNAYLDGDTIHMIGTDVDRFAFKKCMFEAGQPTEHAN